MAIAARDELLRNCLDDVAARIRMRRGGRRTNLDNARRMLLDVISKDHGMVSFRLVPSDVDVIQDYFDGRADFEPTSRSGSPEPYAGSPGHHGS